MKGVKAQPIIIVFATVPTKKEARTMSQALVKKRLAACVNILGPIQSVYRWKGKIVKGQEILLMMKSTQKRFAALKRELATMHSYEVPEIIAVPVVAGHRPYLGWVVDQVN